MLCYNIEKSRWGEASPKIIEKEKEMDLEDS